MADQPLYFITSAVTVGGDGAEGTLQYYSNSVVPDNSISVSTNSDWITLGTLDLTAKTISYSIGVNNGHQRSGQITIGGRALVPGVSQPQVVTDYATIVQNSLTGGTGEITVSTSSVDIPANGSGGTIGFTTNNINTSTIGVSPDNPEWLLIEDYTSTGFTWRASRNDTNATRTARVTITGRKQSGDDYAYGYVGFVQPAMSDVGYIRFSTNTIQPSATAVSASTTYTYSNITAITSVVCSESWLHDNGHGTLGTFSYSVDANPYSNRRNGYITLNAISTIDGSLIQGTLYFEQQANSSGATQVGFIYCDNPSITTSGPEATGGSFTLYTQNMNDSSLYIASSGGNWNTLSLSAGNLLVTWTVKDSSNSKGYTTSTVSIGGQDISGNTVNPITLQVNQPPYVEYIEFPIWKDTDIIIDNESEYLDYLITIDNDPVFSGRAYTLGGYVKIRLNTIMEQLLIPELDITVQGLQDNNAYANATLSISLDGEHYVAYKQVKCYADWSYKPNYQNIISKPIKREVDKRQMLLCSAIDHADSAPTMIVTQVNGAASVSHTYSLTNKIGTVVQSVGNNSRITVSAGGQQVTYLVVDSCKRYCLYYLNARGGWDSYLFENTSKETDTFNRFTFKRRINNQKPVHGTVEYKNKITKKWTLKTGFLSDEQSINLAENMMSSPCAYLHDLDENIIYPVIVTTKTTDYRTFYRNGRKFSRYDIEVTNAQNRQRR